jgi:glycerol-3-phosphate acyltransferase PlsX
MDKITVAVDAMGGDNAPALIVEGCISAIKQEKTIKVLLVGDETLIKKELSKYQYDKNQIDIVDAKEIIENTEAPVLAIRRKKDSSIVKGLRLVKNKEADAFVSAGSTGAVLAGGTLIVGRIKGIERPALGSLIPTSDGFSLLIDCGANVDSKPSFLVQFAKMGSIYYESFLGIKNPKIGLLNIGDEAEKGNNLTKETYKLLKEEKNINFIGNIEARDVSNGDAHVVVCDGFVGNVILKYTEGFAMSLFGILKKAFLSNTKSKIGALLLKKSMKNMMKQFDYTEYGGVPLLGLQGLVVKAHGSSNAKAFKNAILQCKKFVDEDVNEKIRQKI